MPDIVTSPEFLLLLGVIGILILVALARTMDLFFLLVTSVGVILLAIVVIAGLLALAGIDRSTPPVANPPV